MNIYYEPEKFGLTIFAFIEKARSYDFNMFIVWEDKAGNLFYGQDNGCSCSCPSPFESKGIDDLQMISKTSLDSFKTSIKSWYDNIYSEKPSVTVLLGIIEKVENKILGVAK
ncbi:MAG: hypothetical protein Q7R52_00170 [archaeon]|nr:hypothetical protein [archaeon]